MGHLLSQREAAREWGIGRTTIQRAISDGKLSLTGQKLIDPSEMLRAFGEPRRPHGPDHGPSQSPDKATLVAPPDPAQISRIAVLEAELAGLKATLAAKDSHIEDLRGQVRLLTHDGAGGGVDVKSKKPWWRWV